MFLDPLSHLTHSVKLFSSLCTIDSSGRTNFYFWDNILSCYLYNSGWLGTTHADQTGFEFVAILQSLLPGYWDDMHVPHTQLKSYCHSVFFHTYGESPYPAILINFLHPCPNGSRMALISSYHTVRVVIVWSVVSPAFSSMDGQPNGYLAVRIICILFLQRSSDFLWYFNHYSLRVIWKAANLGILLAIQSTVPQRATRISHAASLPLVGLLLLVHGSFMHEINYKSWPSQSCSIHLRSWKWSISVVFITGLLLRLWPLCQSDS